MLEVGRVVEPAPGTFYSWNRAHFGAWCIVSSPLILGMELSDEILAPVLDIIGNTEAIAVNQAWDGMPGMLVKVWQPSIIPDAFGGLINAALDIVGSSVKPPPPPPPPAVQLWAKRLGGGAMAVLLINASPTSLAAGTISIPLEDLNMTHASNVNVRDIWARTDWGGARHPRHARLPGLATVRQHLPALGPAVNTIAKTVFAVCVPFLFRIFFGVIIMIFASLYLYDACVFVLFFLTSRRA